MVAVLHVSGTSTLNHFNLIDVTGFVRVPDSAGIFNSWTDNGHVGGFFYPG